jgi:cell division protein FtsN
MAKPDLLTISIVVVCLAGLIFLVVRTFDLLKNDNEPSAGEQLMEEAIQEVDPVTEEETTTDYYFDDVEESGTADNQEVTGSPEDFRTIPSKDSDMSVEEYQAINRQADNGLYMVIAGSYKVRRNAEKEVARLQSLGYSTARVGVFNQGTYASVLVNAFDSKADASALVAELKAQHNIPSYIQERR